MGFMDKLKSNKQFRFKVIIIAFLAIFIFTQMSGDKKAATWTDSAICDQYNNAIGDLFGIDSNTDITLCKQYGCHIKVYRAPITLWSGATASVCVSYVNDYEYTEEDGASSCLNYNSIEITGVEKASACGDFFTNCYKCLPQTPESVAKQCNNSGEQGIASFIQSMGLLKDNCKAAYYITLIGGGFLALMVFAII